MQEKFEERPDSIRYENDDDIIEVRPASWELFIHEKDSGEEYVEQFDTKDEAREEMLDEIKESREESAEDDNDDFEDIHDGDDEYDEQYGG